MKYKILAVVVLFVLSWLAMAEDPEPPKPILKKGEVKHFIKTFPLLKKDFENFGIKYEAKAGTITYPEALAASAEYLAILKKHGWDEHYFEKAAAIILGYSSIVYGKEIKKADPELEKSIKQIESNAYLSEAVKKQMIEQIKMAKGVLKSQEQLLKKRLHKSDMDLIRPHIEAIKQVLEDKPGKK
ncbi:MAG: hypothetical protein GTO45_04740 [Candidatus Aminicenantes bacterium]|nr:hypothetical protein [Candidatus Aminicenantes bacterium]NIM78060.1 hypothetical protein [Candidatus Aminicenantes bacterium]NIN17377.1 hypothetical protein [Candidatus Aminicenantes bacterium]NIN41270.1 hypothetical protein [Candidatus Aminicenantes bacterium]NIN84043.1 hypothetical protein [Candidatus Aminicenantes bacterium]